MCQKFHNGNLRAHSFIAHSTTKTSSLRTLDISTTRCCFKCRLNVLPKVTKPFVSITCIRPSWDASVSSKNTLIIIVAHQTTCTVITSLSQAFSYSSSNFKNHFLPSHHNQDHQNHLRKAKECEAWEVSGGVRGIFLIDH